MKRVKPLQARSPLGRGKPLTRSTPLTARAPLRAASAPAGTRRASRTTVASTLASFSPAVCTIIDIRDSDDSGAVPVRLCQRCGDTRDLHRHHRRLKDAGGSSNRPHTHCACNAALVCLRCHDVIHNLERREAEAQGFIVSQAEDEPGSVSVMRFAAAGGGGASQWPTCDGRWADEAPAGVAA